MDNLSLPERSSQEGEAAFWPRPRLTVPAARSPLLTQGQPTQPLERCYQSYGSPRAQVLQAAGKRPPKGSSWAKGKPGPLQAWP